MENAMLHLRCHALCTAIAGVTAVYTGVAAAQMLETETARVLPQGTLEVTGAYEHQVSTEGTEGAVPFALEYGLSQRIEFLVEPVAYTAIRPNNGAHATGPGDLETTLTCLLRREGSRAPALALAGELKIPTAESVLIGTDQYDYTTYLIASRRFGAVDAHANLGYAILGQPPGVTLNNTFSFAVAAILHPESRLQWFAEVLGVTASAPEANTTSSTNESSVAPETGGAELNGTLGASFAPRPSYKLYLAVTYDNNNAVLFRPGVTLRFQ
jgi:hypothetical protein